MKLILIIFCLFYSSCVFAMGLEERLEQLEKAYFVGEYDAASLGLKKIEDLGHIEGASRDVQARFWLLRARTAAAFDRISEMQNALDQLLIVDPDKELDPYTDPPALQKYWRDIRKTTKPIESRPTTNLLDETFSSKHDRVSESLKLHLTYMPFGFGHAVHEKYFDAALFAGGDLMLWYGMASQKFRMAIAGENAYLVVFPMFVGFIGSWSYQVTSLMPELQQSNRSYSKMTRRLLSFAPLGASQAKNGDWNKAAVVGSMQAGLLYLYLTQKNNSRWVPMTGFLLSYTYGVMDSFLNHVEPREVSKTAFWSPFVQPLDNGVGYGLSLTLKL